MKITYAIFEEDGQIFAARNVEDRNGISTGVVPIDDERVPDFLRSAEVGATFDEDGNSLDDLEFEDDDEFDEDDASDSEAFEVLGGPGSGFFGHTGRPGQAGGSAHSALDEVPRPKVDADPQDPTPIELAYADLLEAGLASRKRGMEAFDTSAILNPDGSYTTTRRELHKQILEQMSNPNAPAFRERPVAILMGGLPGAGKTTATSDLSRSDKVFISADDIKPLLGDVNSPLAHKESTDVADKLLLKTIAMRQDLISDSTLYRGAEERIQLLKDAGYRVEIRYTDVSVPTSVDRVVRRFVAEELAKPGKGRLVPPACIRSLADRSFSGAHSTKPREFFERKKSVVDAWTLVNNDGKAPKVVASSGTLTK